MVLARELTNAGKRCVIVGKRNHIGGNIYTERIAGIDIHKYGPHIFPASNKMVWEHISTLFKNNNRKRLSAGNFPVNGARIKNYFIS